jgi:hypothetical protein
MRYRIGLPVIFGVVTVVLSAWFEHNMQLIVLAGDDNPPAIWPSLAPSLLAWSINAPALKATEPLSRLNLPELAGNLQLLTVIAWWWWVGTRLDFGILGKRRPRHPKKWAVFIAAVACLSIGVGVRTLLYEFPTRLPGRNAQVEYVLPFACATVRTLWFFVLSGVLSFAVFRLGTLREFDAPDKDANAR